MAQSRGPRKRESPGFAYASYGSYHENSMLWRVMADIVVAVHAAFVGIVVVGFAAIPKRLAAPWRGGGEFYLPAAHPAVVLLGFAEAPFGTSCPLPGMVKPRRVKGDR